MSLGQVDGVAGDVVEHRLDQAAAREAHRVQCRVGEVGLDQHAVDEAHLTQRRPAEVGELHLAADEPDPPPRRAVQLGRAEPRLALPLGVEPLALGQVGPGPAHGGEGAVGEP